MSVDERDDTKGEGSAEAPDSSGGVELAPAEVVAPTDTVESKAPDLKWYVIHANTGHENKVRRNIEQSIRAEDDMQEFFGEILVDVQVISVRWHRADQLT